jgi:hypothetical protein
MRRWSVLPSRVLQTIHGLGDVPFIARAGNGVIYYRGGSPPPAPTMPATLLRRVKDIFDPNQILPDIPA